MAFLAVTLMNQFALLGEFQIEILVGSPEFLAGIICRQFRDIFVAQGLGNPAHVGRFHLLLLGANIFNIGTGASLSLVRRHAADNVCLGIAPNDRHIRIVTVAVPFMTLAAGVNQLVYFSQVNHLGRPSTGGKRKAEQTNAC